MSWREHTEQGLYALVIAAILGVAAFIRSLIRKVFTNEQQIEVLREQMKSMGEDIHDIKKSNEKLIDHLLGREK
jgi:uncharacterized membrane protein (DUF106 family)